MAGTFVAQPNIQAVLWALDGAGLVMAAALLTLKYFRTGHDLVAGGFLVFAIAGGRADVGNGGRSRRKRACVCGGHCAVGARAPAHQHSEAIRAGCDVRLLGTVSAILFAIVAARIFWGEQLLPTSSPLPFYAYPFLVMTFMGWIWSLLREKA
jgi:hypothetical protein